MVEMRSVQDLRGFSLIVVSCKRTDERLDAAIRPIIRFPDGGWSGLDKDYSFIGFLVRQSLLILLC